MELFNMNTEELLQWKEEGLTLREISEQTGINYYTLRSRYLASNIEFKRGQTNWNLDGIFNELDINGQYAIGFLAADGYIDRRTVCVYVHEKDIELIYRISVVLGVYEPPVHYRVNTLKSRQTGLIIGSVELVKYLSNHYGFQPQKSRTLPFPRHLVNPLPFLRGFFDGDGHIGNSCTFTVGSYDFAVGLLDWINKNYGYTPNIQMVGMNKDVYNIHFRKKHERFIRDLFSYPGLNRKTEAFLKYLPN